MQTVRREYMREYRERNAERIREIRRESARRQRAILYANRPARILPPKKIKAIEIKPKKPPKTAAEKSAYLKEYRRINADRIREARNKLAREARSLKPKDYETRRKFVRKAMTKTQSMTFAKRIHDRYQVKTPIGLCDNCARKYLLPLGCLFCK